MGARLEAPQIALNGSIIYDSTIQSFPWHCVSYSQVSSYWWSVADLFAKLLISCIDAIRIVLYTIVLETDQSR